MNNQVNYIIQHKEASSRLVGVKKFTSCHIAVYNALFLVWNQSGFPDELPIVRSEIMAISKVGSANTYTKILKELEKEKFISYKPSYNPLVPSVIQIYKFDKGTDKGTDKGSGKGVDKGTDKGNATYNTINIETIKQLYADKLISVAQLKKLAEETALFYSEITEGEKISFERFWELYPIKVAKQKCKDKWDKLLVKDQKAILEVLPKYLAYKPFATYNHPNPETFLNQKRWEDEIQAPAPQQPRPSPHVPPPTYTAEDLFQIPKNNPSITTHD